MNRKISTRKTLILMLLGLSVFLAYKVHLFFMVWDNEVEQKNVHNAFKSLSNRLIVLETFGKPIDPTSGPCVVARKIDVTSICKSHVEIRTHTKSENCYPASVYVRRTNGVYAKDGEFVVRIFTQSRHEDLENGLRGPYDMDRLNYPSTYFNRATHQPPNSPMGLEMKEVSECDGFYVYIFGEKG
ncbi:hypothetical protein [Phycobacter sp. K97]|uniref:hypothetical protein n=1 Tax=Phycobacter sedimenti TaxID=3133977 RepID=UPI00311F179E